MRNFLCFSLLFLITSAFFHSCSTEEVDQESVLPNQYTLTLSAGEGGSWVPDANGTTYDEGVIMTLTAVPDEGYAFDRFLGSDNDGGNCGSLNRPPPSPNNCRAIILMNSDRDVWAFFSKLE